MSDVALDTSIHGTIADAIVRVAGVLVANMTTIISSNCNNKQSGTQ